MEAHEITLLCLKQGQLVTGLLRFSHFEVLPLEREEFRNPEEGERPLLEAATKQRG
jgi:hypothetical protein